MAKQRPIWKSEGIDASIGPKIYKIEPQPLGKILEFDAVIDDLSSNFDDLADRFFVQNKEGNDLAGPFATWAAADQHIKDNDLQDAFVRTEGIELKQVLERLVKSPYKVLKPLIPDLDEAHVIAAPLPQLRVLLEVLVEVNGLEWFEKLLKNVVEPLLPQILGAAVGGVRGALKLSTKPTAIPDGETQ